MEISKNKKIFLSYFLMVACAFLLINAMVYSKSIVNNEHAELIDTDTYMRLVRVEQLAETGDWYDSVIHRSNYPYGDELHWTRPLDVLLLAGAYTLTPFQGFHQGLLTWGIIISPLLGIFCLLALYWASRPVMNKNARRLLWLLFIAQSLLLQIFAFGRPDHHSLLMLLFILLLGCMFRTVEQPNNHRYILLSGLIAAFSFWVSVETIFAIIMVFITLGVLWLIRGEAYTRQLLLFSLSIFMFSSIFLFIERPLSSILAVEYDKISIAHLFVFMLAILASYLLTLIKKNTDLFSKLTKSALLILASGLMIRLIFPAFYQGPLAGINQAIVPIWLSKVSEVQPLWTLDVFNATIVIGSIILFLLYLAYLVVKKEPAGRFVTLLPILCGFAVFLPLGIYQVRMDYYLILIIIMLLAIFLDDIIGLISNAKMRDVFKPILRIAVMLFFVMGLPGIGMLASTDSNKNAAIEPDVKALSSFLNKYQQTNPTTKTVLTHIDFGPELLYRTNLNIIAGPYHRNDRGILYIYNVMAAGDSEQAKAMLKQRSVDLLILCPKSTEIYFYKRTKQHTTFYEQLLAGDKPDYLKEVVLPANIAKTFIVFELKQ